jgi:uncharacterized protein DUF1553/uncharacterized protein DUF1549/cytochrome c
MKSANRRHSLLRRMVAEIASRALRLVVLGALLADSASANPEQPAVSTPQTVDFNRVIRPILSENCYKCHGPDDGARKANLRFDVRAEALRPTKSGRIAIVPGAPQQSEMVTRVTAPDPEKRMPPLSTGKRLSPGQIESLRSWISQGAVFAPHWAYVKPVKPPLPEIHDKNWARNSIDRFILARLERDRLKPSAEADRYTLIRRASLDLTGLPPTPEEVDAFVKDTSPYAYERLVDSLLKKEAFGEHWARMWLDLARYADSAGYADDPPRTIWGYRDYVIKSFNGNKPFDRFSIEQIAGDLLSEPTEEDRVATGFHRNTMTNNEGGTDDEEFRNAAVVDRVNTTMAVWMGTSMACAQCHHHKYDPFSQQEYFRLFAILNNTEDADRSDEAPVKRLYTPAQRQELAQAQAESWEIEQKFKKTTPESLAQQAQWDKEFPLELVWQSALGLSSRPLTKGEEAVQYTDPTLLILELIESPCAHTEDQQALLSQWYRSHVAPELKPEQDRYAELQREIDDIKPNTVPMMHELEGDKRRKTHVQLRGNFLALGEEVTEAVPAVFHPLPQEATPDRLALARWLVDQDNPLTARVIANHFWEQIFGIGIVRTSEDFGSQGELPTHPELLDWLATAFVASGWDVKALLKLLVTSATYCQSSRVTPELLERDPDNVLLARGPRFRLTAEEVRDQALFVSGLLSRKMYGPPVRPPQPSLGLTAAFGGSLDWKPSEGEDRYRRAVYVEWRRTNPYPSMATFDAPNREVCALRRPRSNTPLQALVTLNDPVYVEAARALGSRMMQAEGSTEAKTTYGFRLCLGRPPQERELKRLVEFYGTAQLAYNREPEEARKLTSDPGWPAPASADAIELATWTAMGNVLLNLDELLMRP